MRLYFAPFHTVLFRRKSPHAIYLYRVRSYVSLHCRIGGGGASTLFFFWKADYLFSPICCCCCSVTSVVSDSVWPHRRQPPGSPVPGILQARTLEWEWVAISFSNAGKWKVKVKLLSPVRLLATPWTAAYQAPPSMGFPRQSTGVGCHCLLRFPLFIYSINYLYYYTLVECLFSFSVLFSNTVIMFLKLFQVWLMNF